LSKEKETLPLVFFFVQEALCVTIMTETATKEVEEAKKMNRDRIKRSEGNTYSSSKETIEVRVSQSRQVLPKRDWKIST
jgi:hypothetical protein